MPGLLITPEQYFLDLHGRPTKNFTDWQMNFFDGETRHMLYAEIAELTYDKETETLLVRFDWAVHQKAGAERQMLSDSEMNLSLRLTGYFGASHKDGGCHFEFVRGAWARFALDPPGTLEKSAHAEAWLRIKAIGVGAA